MFYEFFGVAFRCIISAVLEWGVLSYIFTVIPMVVLKLL